MPDNTEIVDTIYRDRNGDYKIKLSKRKKDFFGQELNQFQIFRRLGNLPDNHVLANKLINALGKNLLSLMKQRDEITLDERILNKRREELNGYLELEAESNSFHISVLEQLSFLEMHRDDDGKIWENEDQELSIKKNALIEDLNKKYEERIENLHKIKAPNNIYIIRIKQQVAIIKSNQASTLALLKNEGTNLQTFYRKIMDDFAKEQRQISIYQHRADRPLDYANRSLTEGYQNASYAMEKHVFTVKKPIKQQLWMMEEDKDITIDTRRYPSMKKEDALYTAFYISPSPNDKNNIKQSVDKQKQSIIENSKKNRGIKTTVSPTTSIMQKPPQKPTEDNLTVFITNLKSDSQLNKTTLWPEVPLDLFESKDMFSAIGFACVDFAKYFESEMAAKKPVMTAAMFLAMSATFGAAGLAQAGMNSAHSFSAMMVKILSVNGKLGISPEQMQAAINAISNTWLELTYSKGSLMHVLIMNGFGLPKIQYTLIDSLINHSENKDTLSLLAERLSRQDLTGYTDEEEKRRIIRNVFMVSLMLGGAIALGLSIDILGHTHGPLASIAQELGTLIEVPKEAFTNLAGHTISEELFSILALVLTVKSAGLFLVKVLLVLGHMKTGPSHEAKDAAVFFATLKEGFDSGDFDLTKLKKEDNDNVLAYYRDHFEKLLEQEPKLKKLFGQKFLDDIGIEKPKRALSERIRNGISSAITSFFKDNLWDKLLLPVVKMVVGLSGVVGFGWGWGETTSSGKFAKEGQLILLGFLTSIGLMLAAGVKTVSISIYGTIQRIILAASDLVFNAALFINYAFQSPLNFFKALGLAAGKILIITSSIVNDVVNFAVALVKYPLALVTGIVGGVFGGLVSGCAKVSDLIFKTRFFDKALDGTKLVMKSPITAGGLYKDKVHEGFRSFLGNYAQEIKDTINDAEGAVAIIKTRDAVTGGINQAFGWVKEKAGKVAYELRNIFVRTQERALQKLHGVESTANLSSSLNSVETILRDLRFGKSDKQPVAVPPQELRITDKDRNEQLNSPAQQDTVGTSAIPNPIMKNF